MKRFLNDWMAVGIVAGFLAMAIGSATLIVGTYVDNELYKSIATASTGESFNTSLSTGRTVYGYMPATAFDHLYPVPDMNITVYCNSTATMNFTVVWTAGAATLAVNSSGGPTNCSAAAVTADYYYTNQEVYEVVSKVFTGVKLGAVAVLGVGAAITIGSLMGGGLGK